MSDHICPRCGSGRMQRQTGTFRMEVPAGLAGGPLSIPNADWTESDACHAQILSQALDRASDEEVDARMHPKDGLLSAK